MPSGADILILAVPVMIAALLVGLGLVLAVVISEGRGPVSTASQLVGLINLALIVPLGLLAWTSESREVRWMFMFAAGAFALIGLLGIKLPRRYRD